MSYNAARSEALFLSDKMAYELGLTNTQYEAVYEINLDYMLNVDTRADVFGFWWDVRNRDLSYVLSTWQYDRYLACSYFYRPIIWNAGNWNFAIYGRYSHGRMFMHRPVVYTSFRGGHNHRNSSFYARHHFDKPNHPKGLGNGNWNHNNGNHNGNWSHNGNGNHNGNWGNNGNGNYNGNHNGNGNHNRNGNYNGNHNNNRNNNGNNSRPSVGNNNNNNTITMGNVNNSRHSSVTSAPSRSFGSRPSGIVASNANKTNQGRFGGQR